MLLHRWECALHDGYLSDHRSLIVDFDAKMLFSSATSDIVEPKSRNLTSTNPKAVKVYVKHLLDFLGAQCIESRVANLAHQSDLGLWSDREIVEWEAIDLLLAQGRTAAENKCPKRKSGSLPWSPDLDLAGKKVQYWKLRLREFTARRSNDTALEKLANSVELKDEDRQWKTSREVCVFFSAAKQAMKQVKANAAALRQDHLDDMAKLSSSLHNMSQPSAAAAIAGS